ncbi:MAG: hypothetical protein ABI659_00885 [Nitrosospira sp.]
MRIGPAILPVIQCDAGFGKQPPEPAVMRIKTDKAAKLTQEKIA